MFLFLACAFLLLPATGAQNVTNGTNVTNITCAVLFSSVPANGVGWFTTSNANSLKTLAQYMLQASTLQCTSTESSTNYIVVSKSAGHLVSKNGASFAQIVSFGAAALCIFLPLTASSDELSKWGLTPSLDKPRSVMFFFSVERMTSDGGAANGDEMIVDMFVSVTCSFVLIFSSGNRNGRSIEGEGGKKAMVTAVKCRLWLPHTSSIAGYDETTTADGSSSGLYGLFALIALPVLACAGLIGYAVYAWWHSAATIETKDPAQPFPQQYQPFPQAYMPQAYQPQPYAPAYLVNGQA